MAYVKFKPPGGKTIKGRPMGTVEAGKYIGPVRAPVNGTILEINQEVRDDPTLINKDSYGKGWIALIEPDNLEEDFKDLIHGEENVQAFLEADYKKYEDEGLFADKEED